VEQCVVVRSPKTKDGLPAFLERYTSAAGRFAD